MQHSQCLKYSTTTAQLGNDKSEINQNLAVINQNWAVTNTCLTQTLAQAPNTATQHLTHVLLLLLSLVIKSQNALTCSVLLYELLGSDNFI